MHKYILPEITRPLVTVDIAIFTVKNQQLQMLLVKRPNKKDELFANQWALPGGFLHVELDDDLDACAVRKLKEKTNVEAPYLEQVGAYGSRSRDPRDWSITHVYFSLLNEEAITLQKGGNAAELAWFPIEKVIELTLAFDHSKLLKAAIERLHAKVEYTSLPVYLLPAEFTLPDLQEAYEIVLNRPLDKSSFRTRILNSDLITALENQFRKTTNRPAQLYRLTTPNQVTYFPRSFKYNESTQS